MKKGLLLVFASLLFVTVSCKKELNTPAKYGEMTFKEREFKFGLIKKGSTVEHVFKFKNTGDTDLVIKDAKGSCGCTIPEYPKKPVKPGDSSEIKVSFNSKGKRGKQKKVVTIFANTEKGAEKIMIRAIIDMDEQEQANHEEAKKVFKNLK